MPARAANGQVIVVGTNPAALDANGQPVIPFWEDVTVVAGSRIFGMTCNLPGDPGTSHNCREDLNSTRYEVDALRMAAGFEGDLFGSDNWHYTADYVYASNGENDTTFGSAFSMPNLRAGLAGFGGSGCIAPSNDPLLTGTIRPGTGNCQFFNIFGTSVTTTPGSLIANTQDMVTYITAQDWALFEIHVGGDRLHRLGRCVLAARRQGRPRDRRPAPHRRLVGRLPGAAERGTERPAGALLRQGRGPVVATRCSPKSVFHW